MEMWRHGRRTRGQHIYEVAFYAPIYMKIFYGVFDFGGHLAATLQNMPALWINHFDIASYCAFRNVQSDNAQ